MDTLSDVLSLLEPRSYMAGGIDVGSDVSVRFPKHQGIKCYALVSGQCWLTVEDGSDPLLMNAGDCFILPRGLPFHLASSLELAPVDFHQLMPAGRVNGGVVKVHGGGHSFIVGGYFHLDDRYAQILLGELPTVVHLRSESDKSAMRWSLHRMMQELREPQPGGFLVIQHLATLMLVQALRLHLSDGIQSGSGWLAALSDRQIRITIDAMHSEPARQWTLQDLAKLASMSRSSFAARFKETVGSSPMDYLTRWRMLRAGHRLIHTDDPISVIAPMFGYESESAFGNAFKRIMGCSPRSYSRDRKTTAH
ncbi:AraC family transcriptional regulator [Luteolibacter pohnpeiensis]|uniref:AraC family transcriptional regulator n=1 Tax=Luteolibacter pohnpeiensis TaxID=454153 RepID=A0A934SB70_9BACT|nr:AraC family transcriptional regulator [Luteolibacter pohnpeiensis]MBK1882972.1 AraC family transcriptional regulator [Luteolibacter pohnpeiensis]